MGLGSWLKSRLDHKAPDCTPEYAKVLAFNATVRALLAQDKFISRSECARQMPEYKDCFSFFETLSRSEMLRSYVRKHHLERTEIEAFTALYSELLDPEKEPFKSHNDNFIKTHLRSEKAYLDEILMPCDPNITLDDEQRTVVLSDEDYTLVIAGAGAGKTTTVAAKVRYLVERQHIAPEEILVLSFTNKAVGELKERINQLLGIKAIVSTFHSVGYTILNGNSEDHQRIAGEGHIYNVLSKYLRSEVLSDPSMVDKLVLFFGSYFTAPYEGDELQRYFRFVSEADFSTLRSKAQDYFQGVLTRNVRSGRSIQNEVLRSQEEVNIANYLYMNGIDYEYEPLYKYRILYSNKPYTPDFIIRQGDKFTYIEHFGITESGENSRYSHEEIERYKKCVRDKITLHRKHKTDLIYTFSQYNDSRTYLEHLHDELLHRGYELNPRDNAEVYRKIADNESASYIKRLVLLICDFIRNFKTQGYDESRFEQMKAATKNVRTALFLDICKVCYLEYQRRMHEDDCIDFQDMINDSVLTLADYRRKNKKLKFKYIIVDEYQDISRQRYNLISELSKLCSAKIMAVGDDWQSVYAFSGSYLPLFTQFRETFGYAQMLLITRTYRNAQQLIDIAGTFVQKNSLQIRKRLISGKSIENPVIVDTYDDQYDPKGLESVFYKLGLAVNRAIKNIVDSSPTGRGPVSILLIGRYGFDARNLCKSPLFNYNETTLRVYSATFGGAVKLSFLTAHSSKGLTADHVIIINAKDHQYGFPSKVSDDPLFTLVVNDDKSYEYAEERRLFYVALTRTKNRVYLITPQLRPSTFVCELIRERSTYPNVEVRGELKGALDPEWENKKLCPFCGYPMVHRGSRNFGLDLWICTNDQELCGFMTNDLKGVDLPIVKCDCCRDGYLIVKQGTVNGKRSYFLGCTNYRADKTGCDRRLSRSAYMKWREDGFSNDVSANGKVFLPLAVDLPPQAPLSSRRPSTCANTIFKTRTELSAEGYQLLYTDDGKLLTDMDLLLALDRWVSGLKVRPVSKDALVEIATSHPQTIEELLGLYGIGEGIVRKWGQQILQIVRTYPTNSRSSS